MLSLRYVVGRCALILCSHLFIRINITKCYMSKLCNPLLDCTRYKHIISRVPRNLRDTNHLMSEASSFLFYLSFFFLVLFFCWFFFFLLEVLSFRFEERNQSEPHHDINNHVLTTIVFLLLFCYFIHSIEPIIIICRKNGFSLFILARISFKMSNFYLLFCLLKTNQHVKRLY